MAPTSGRINKESRLCWDDNSQVDSRWRDPHQLPGGWEHSKQAPKLLSASMDKLYLLHSDPPLSFQPWTTTNTEHWTLCKYSHKTEKSLCENLSYLDFHSTFLSFLFYSSFISISTMALPRLQVTYKCCKWIWSYNSCERTPQEPWNMCKDPWPLQ